MDNFVEFQAAARAYWAGFNATNPPELNPKYPMPEFFGKAIYMVQSGGNDLYSFKVRNLTYADMPGFSQNMTDAYETFVKVSHGC